MVEYYSPTTADDVTDEMIELVVDIIDWVESWRSEDRKDWLDIWDRMDGTTLSDGRMLDMPTDLLSPVYKRLKAEVRKSERD